MPSTYIVYTKYNILLEINFSILKLQKRSDYIYNYFSSWEKYINHFTVYQLINIFPLIYAPFHGFVFFVRV